MTAAWTVIALIVPWAAGIALVTALGDRRGGKVLAIGGGWLAGQAMMMAALYVSLVASGSGHARIVLGILAFIAVILLAYVVYSSGGSAIPETRSERLEQSPDSRRFRLMRRVMMGVIVASLLAKVYLLVCSHAFVPRRNDDAISIWLFKAKVIASLDQLPQDPASPYYLGGSNPHYSVFVPLAASWIPMVTGQWREQLATLPWLFYYVNLFLLVAGGLRRWMTSVQSWIAAYVVASLPLMVIHAYRPGYADLILACFLAATVLYLLIWRETNLARHLLTAAMFAVFAALLKRESPALVAIAVLAVLMSSGRHILAWSVRACVVAAVVGGAAVLTVAMVVDFSEQKEAAAVLGYHPAVWAKLAQHLFEWSSFHFLFWGLLAVAAAAFCIRRTSSRMAAILLTIGLCGFHAAVFLLTPQARFALNDQTPSRLFMQLVPSLVLAWAIPLSCMLNGSGPAVSRDALVGEPKEAVGGQV